MKKHNEGQNSIAVDKNVDKPRCTISLTDSVREIVQDVDKMNINEEQYGKK